MKRAMVLALLLYVCPALAIEPPSVDQVKEAFKKAIIDSGYVVGDATNAAIAREAPKIAQTMEEIERW